MTRASAQNTKWDVIIVGAGAAGLMAAAVAGQRGLKVLLVDHARRLAEKIRISGGGRCNFTNTGVSHEQYITQNPNFCKFALLNYGWRDFVSLVEKHKISWHEKHKGQLFCDESSENIIKMLRSECDKAGVDLRLSFYIDSVEKTENGFLVLAEGQKHNCQQLVIATGGMSIPKLGATDFALKIARQFNLKVVEPRPALVPLTFDAQYWSNYKDLSGLSLNVDISNIPSGADKKTNRKNKIIFNEDLLFTHKGLSGPAVLQISSYWNSGEEININLMPEINLADHLLKIKHGNKQHLLSVISALWPKRLAQYWLEENFKQWMSHPIADIPNKVLNQLGEGINNWRVKPSGTVGYKKAEAMRGGVDTSFINQKTMQTKNTPGLYFIGEALDVTGWLGGYNFQWAWASAVACARSL